MNEPSRKHINIALVEDHLGELLAPGVGRDETNEDAAFRDREALSGTGTRVGVGRHEAIAIGSKVKEMFDLGN